MDEKLITWDDSFITEINEIDNQHIKLIEILNDLYSVFLNNNLNGDLIKDYLQKILDYTNYHFSTEEQYFEKFNYIHTEKHKMEHRVFVNKINQFYDHYLNEQHDISLNLILYLKDWIIEHILYSDRKYIDTFISHGLK